MQLGSTGKEAAWSGNSISMPATSLSHLHAALLCVALSRGLYSVERCGPEPLTRKICRASGLSSRGKGRSSGQAVQGGAPARTDVQAHTPCAASKESNLAGWVHETAL